ncbi:MAG TPA: hypothetical protein VMR70_16350 [Flavisolibacter sp.]|nr:hypothetical protein [Flavisolibacter sp.]
MKKLITFFLLLLYFTFSAGTTFHLHYCMGEYVSFSLSDTKDGECEKCGMNETSDDNSCCQDVQVSAKISDSHHLSLIHYCPEAPSVLMTTDFPTTEVQTYQAPRSHTAIHPYPPGGLDRPLFIQFRNIRI